MKDKLKEEINKLIENNQKFKEYNFLTESCFEDLIPERTTWNELRDYAVILSY